MYENSSGVATLRSSEEVGGEERRRIQFLIVTFPVQYASPGQIVQSGGISSMPRLRSSLDPNGNAPLSM